jgi:hypothetical protein
MNVSPPATKTRPRRPWELGDEHAHQKHHQETEHAAEHARKHSSSTTSSSNATTSTALTDYSPLPAPIPTRNHFTPMIDFDSSSYTTVTKLSPQMASSQHFSHKRPRTEQIEFTEASFQAININRTPETYHRPWESANEQQDRVRRLAKDLLEEISAHEVLVHGTSFEANGQDVVMKQEVDMTGGDFNSKTEDIFAVALERMKKSNKELKTLLDAIGLSPKSEAPASSKQPVSPAISQHNTLIATPRRTSFSSDQHLQLDRANYQIISLTSDRDRLSKQVLALEKQVRDVKISRNEARKARAEVSKQYLRILEGLVKQKDDIPEGSKKENVKGKKRDENPGEDGGDIDGSQFTAVDVNVETQLSNADDDQDYLTRVISESVPVRFREQLRDLEEEVKALRKRNGVLETTNRAAEQVTKQLAWIFKGAVDSAGADADEGAAS